MYAGGGNRTKIGWAREIILGGKECL